MSTLGADRWAHRDDSVVLLGAGFAAALVLRVLIGGAGVSRSPGAGAAFACALLLLSAAVAVRVPVSVKAVGTGLAGAAALCLPVIAVHGTGGLHDTAGFGRWAPVVCLVAVAEEVFLRGALYEAVQRAHGEVTAIAAGALGFALLHLPLYGWRAVGLDLFVGTFLGELRRRSGGPAAPALAHTAADLAAWFLR